MRYVAPQRAMKVKTGVLLKDEINRLAKGGEKI
jgi:hypothetical protein